MADFSKPLEVLFKPKRYKVLWGGRAAGRSWGIARALLIIGASRPIRVLCAREFQNSIAESVHKVLSDQIEALGLSGHYEIQNAKIIGKNGTTFSFEGIKNNIARIKSYEGIDYCWVEEAVKVSQASWDVLIPTIRKRGSEIWLSFNPELEDDHTYVRFVKLPGGGPWQTVETDNSFIVHMTYRDNPWVTQEILDEAEATKALDYDAYQNVWLGLCRQILAGVVYSNELRRAYEAGRVTRVPYSPEFPVHTFWDLGRADYTSIWFAQRVAMEYRVLGYYQASAAAGDFSAEDESGGVNHFLKYLENQRWVYGEHWLPHDAKAKRLGSKRTIEEMIRAAYPGKVHIVERQSLSDGINAARMFFPNCWFDEVGCETGLKALKTYRYEVKDGQLSDKPKHDAASHGADAFRYMALALTGAPRRGGRGVMERLRRAGEVTRGQREKAVAQGNSLGWLG